MNDAQHAELAAWIAGAGLAGGEETAMVAGFCERVCGFGLPIARALVFIDTLHPTLEGRIFGWQAKGQETRLTEYGRSNEGETAERWRRSPFYRLLETGETVFRRKLTGETNGPALRSFRSSLTSMPRA